MPDVGVTTSAPITEPKLKLAQPMPSALLPVVTTASDAVDARAPLRTRTARLQVLRSTTVHMTSYEEVALSARGSTIWCSCSRHKVFSGIEIGEPVFEVSPEIVLAPAVAVLVIT